MGAQLSGGGGSRGGGRRYRARPMADINVTPMVDVMLVLLIVFMVAAPMLTVGVPVDLPKSNAPPMNQADDKPLEVTVKQDGRIYVGETEIVAIDGAAPEERLVLLLNQISQENREAKIYVRGDAQATYAQIMQVMGALTAGGFTKVALVSLPKDVTN